MLQLVWLAICLRYHNCNKQLFFDMDFTSEYKTEIKLYSHDTNPARAKRISLGQFKVHAGHTWRSECTTAKTNSGMITSSSSAIFPSLAVIRAECVLLSYVLLWLAPSGEVIGSDPFEKMNLDGRRAGETKTHMALSVTGLWVQEMAKKKHRRRKERGIHNRPIISSSDNWPCYMQAISIQINMASLELYHRELHLQELTSQSSHCPSHTCTHSINWLAKKVKLFGLHQAKKTTMEI